MILRGSVVWVRGQCTVFDNHRRSHNSVLCFCSARMVSQFACWAWSARLGRVPFRRSDSSSGTHCQSTADQHHHFRIPISIRFCWIAQGFSQSQIRCWLRPVGPMAACYCHLLSESAFWKPRSRWCASNRQWSVGFGCHWFLFAIKRLESSLMVANNPVGEVQNYLISTTCFLLWPSSLNVAFSPLR